MTGGSSNLVPKTVSHSPSSRRSFIQSEIYSIDHLSIEPDNFPAFQALVSAIVSATRKDPARQLASEYPSFRVRFAWTLSNPFSPPKSSDISMIGLRWESFTRIDALVNDLPSVVACWGKTGACAARL